MAHLTFKSGQSHSPFFGTLPFVLSALCGIYPAGASADLLSFCLAAAPSDAALLAIYNAQCPAYLQSQFLSATASTQASAVTTQLAQQQSEAAILAAYAALVKPPAAQISQGVDVAPLAIAALLKDAQLTFSVAKTIGQKLRPGLSEANQAILITAADLSSLLSNPVDSTTVEAALNDYSGKVQGLACTGPAPPAVAPATLAGVLGAEALLSAISTAVSMFQPTLLAAAVTKGVTDPQQIMAAGVIAGLAVIPPEQPATPGSAAVAEAKSAARYLRVHMPRISVSNTVLIALGTLRTALVAANQRLAKCPATDPIIKQAGALIADAKDFISSLVKTDGTKPSLLDIATRRAALAAEHITYTLVLTRDVSGGGVAAIKPNWFSSVSLLMGTADGITYQLVDFDGKVVLTGFESDTWADQCDIDKWTNAFGRCSTAVSKVQ